MRPIKVGEQSLDCYGPAYWKDRRVERQLKLTTKYGFTCQCVACEKLILCMYECMQNKKIILLSSINSSSFLNLLA